MFKRLAMLLASNSRRGNRPSSLCLWEGLDEMQQLAEELAKESLPATDGEDEIG